MKTIFLVITVSAKINFVLRTDLLEALRAHGFFLVIISPFSGKSEFRKEFEHANTALETFVPNSRIANTITNIRKEALKINHPKLLEAQRLMRGFHRRRDTFRSLFSKKLTRLVVRLIPPKARVSMDFWDMVDALTIRNRANDLLFKKYKPSLVILDNVDPEFLVYCKKYSVPSLYIDINIDAFWNRFPERIRRTTKIAASGERMKKELLEIQGIEEQRIEVVGAIRYDYFFKNPAFRSRESICKKIGADVNKNLIIYAAYSDLDYPQNTDIIKIILDAIRVKKISAPCQLLVRLPSGYLARDLQALKMKFGEEADLLFQRAEDFNERDDFASMLYRASVVISIGSTMGVEACAVGTPAIWLGFDGYSNYENPADSIRATLTLDHLKVCIESGGIRVAESQEDLIHWIGEYIKNKSLDLEKRKALIETLYYKPDGHAAERIANAAVEIAK